MRPWPTIVLAGRNSAQLAVLVVGPAAGERTGLVERARVEEALDALPDRQSSGRVLALDALLAAHPPRELLAAAQLLELGLPGHAGRLARASALSRPCRPERQH